MRQLPFEGAADILPPQDVDFSALRAQAVPAPTKSMEDAPRYSAERKWLELQAELQGKDSLMLLHAMLIAISRRTDPPPAAMPLFFRMWREQGMQMARELPIRWLISAATTFADCGETADQRACGMGLSTMFDLIKLHDSERRSIGIDGDALHKTVRSKLRPSLAFDMWPYAMGKGDLDKVLLARLWRLAEDDATIRPLAVRMLRMVMSDKRSIFARVQRFKSENSR